MHETKSEKFKGHVDNLYVADGNMRFSGWVASTEPREKIVYYIDIGHPIAFYNYNERKDVAEFYKTSNPDYINSGFDVNIPVPNVNEVPVYALVDGVREDIFMLTLVQDSNVTIAQPLMDETTELKIRKNIVPELIVVDDFYENPDEVREIALNQNFEPDLRYHKGKRTSTKFLAPGTKQLFESLLGRKITNWVEYEYNGIFQYCTAEDPLVYHSDTQSYAAAVYLTPNAPIETGTSFYRSKSHPDIRKTDVEKNINQEVFAGGYYDRTKFELVDTVGNVYNRLAIWNSKMIHSASEYFGTDKYDSRLFHLFFFDIEE